MAIPAEQELVKHYAVNFADGETAGTEKTVFYTIDGTDTATDLSSQMQGRVRRFLSKIRVMRA